MRQGELKLKLRRKKRFDEIRLLFLAMNVDFSYKSNLNMYILSVPEKYKRYALSQILLYRKENSKKKILEFERDFNEFSYYSILLVFFIFYLLQMMDMYFFGFKLLENGALVVAKVREKEWYRIITALTLHADFWHIVSNAFFGGLFSYFVLNMLGIGVGWFVLLLSGIVGNGISVMVQNPSFVSIGSSVFSFGALGALCVIRILGKNGFKLNSFFLPFMSSLAFLGLFGTSPNSDIFGHLFGFLGGVFFAIPFVILGKVFDFKNSFIINFIFGFITIFIVVFSWIIVFKNFHT